MRARYIILITLGALVFGLFGGITGRSVTNSGAASASDGRSWGITEATLKGKLERNGSVKAEESIDAYFNGSFSGFYQDIPFNPNNLFLDLNAGDSEGIYKPGASAELGSSGDPGSWGSAYLPGNVLRVVWHHQTDSGSKRFKLYYTVTKAGESFQDRDVLRVRVWGQYWPAGAGAVAAQMELPVSEGIQAEASPWFVNPQVEIQGNKVTLRTESVPKEQSVDLLITMPKGSLSGAPTQAGNAPSLKPSKAEKIQERYGDSNLKRGLAWIVAYLLLIALPVTLWMLFWKVALRDAAPQGGSRQYETPPGPLVTGYALAEESSPDMNRAMTATLIDLVARDFFTRENVRGEGGEWRLKIGRKEDTPDREVLSEGEVATLDYFNMLLGDDPCIVDDLDSRVTQSQESHNQVTDVHQALLNDIAAGMGEQKSRSGVVKFLAMLWATIMVPLGAILTCTIPLGHLIGAGFWIGCGFTLLLTVFAIGAWPKKDLTKTGAEGMVEAGPWVSYRDFILSFPRMETAPDLQVELWERAFAAALIFGVAKEFSERAKVLVPSLGESGLAFSNTAYYSTALGSSISSAASPPSSSSSGGGGGFSGGGFGGGGGGAW